MKKIEICLFSVFCLAVIGGCTNQSNITATPSASSATEIQATPLASASSTYIAEDQAKAFALKHAGLAESEVTYVKINLDHDDSRVVYDVEFYVSNAEYDYEVDAYTGSILSYDYDINNYILATAPGDNSTYISLDDAKTIALNKANLTDKQITYTEASFEYDDGIAVYQIDFIFDGIEYEVEINAIDKTIVEYNVESQSN